MLQRYVRSTPRTASFDPFALCVRAQIQVSDLGREHQPDQPVGDIGHGPPRLANVRALKQQHRHDEQRRDDDRDLEAPFPRSLRPTRDPDLRVPSHATPARDALMDLIHAADERIPVDALRFANRRRLPGSPTPTAAHRFRPVPVDAAHILSASATAHATRGATDHLRQTLAADESEQRPQRAPGRSAAASLILAAVSTGPELTPLPTSSERAVGPARERPQ
jgi:hypothetical protein